MAINLTNEAMGLYRKIKEKAAILSPTMGVSVQELLKILLKQSIKSSHIYNDEISVWICDEMKRCYDKDYENSEPGQQ